MSNVDQFEREAENAAAVPSLSNQEKQRTPTMGDLYNPLEDRRTGRPSRTFIGTPVGLADLSNRVPGFTVGGYAPDTSQLVEVPARYTEGAEWALPAGWSEEDRFQAQLGMLAIGVYGADEPNIVLGYWQNEDASAFKQVLAYANANGLDWREALNAGLSTYARGGALRAPRGGGGGGGGGGAAPRLPEIADIKLVVDQVTERILGRRLDSERATQFAQQYRDSMLAPPAGQPTQAQAAIEQSVRQAPNLGAEAGATDLAGTFDKFLSILGGIK